MNPENYKHTMQTYSNDQLLEMFNSENLYQEEALLAAVWEAERRNLAFEHLSEMKQKYEGIYQHLIDKEREELSTTAGAVAGELPELFTPMSIFWLTILFNTLFGGLMLAYNMNKVNKPALSTVYLFTVLYTIGGVVLVYLIPANGLFPLLYNLVGALILREVLWKKFIPIQKKFKAKSSQIPFIIGLSYSLLLILLLYFFGAALFPAQ